MDLPIVLDGAVRINAPGLYLPCIYAKLGATKVRAAQRAPGSMLGSHA